MKIYFWSDLMEDQLTERVYKNLKKHNLKPDEEIKSAMGNALSGFYGRLIFTFYFEEKDKFDANIYAINFIDNKFKPFLAELGKEYGGYNVDEIHEEISEKK